MHSRTLFSDGMIFIHIRLILNQKWDTDTLFHLLVILLVGSQNEDTTTKEPNYEDMLMETCYCPGDEYTRLIPVLAQSVADQHRLQSRDADIYRVPVERPEDLPDVAVLG